MRKILIAYIPVLHKGYMDMFLWAYNHGVRELCLLGESVLAEFGDLDYIKRKDAIRAISEKTMSNVLNALDIFDKVSVINTSEISSIIADKVIMPDEDISRSVASKYFSHKDISFKQIFLRWHSKNVTEKYKVTTNCVISTEDFAFKVMNLARKESEKSFDWWRQIGAIIVKDNKPILIAHNRHIPHEQLPYVNGDPRSIFKKGINIGLSTAAHAESVLISAAARRGISLEGVSLFVTDFPCPPCAKLVAMSGIRRCYFSRGYAMLDGEKVMKDSGVELILVEAKNRPSI